MTPPETVLSFDVDKKFEYLSISGFPEYFRNNWCGGGVMTPPYAKDYLLDKFQFDAQNPRLGSAGGCYFMRYTSR